MFYTAPQLAVLIGNFWPLVLALTIWSIIWKGLALWHAARLGHKIWFIALLILNTVGILEIIYIFAVARRQEKKAINSDN